MDFLRILATDNQIDKASSALSDAYKTFAGIVNIVMPILIGVIAIFGIVYGILLGIKFAKADDTEARDNAKKQLINMVIGVLVAIVIAAIMYAIMNGNAIKNLFVQNVPTEI